MILKAVETDVRGWKFGFHQVVLIDIDGLAIWVKWTWPTSMALIISSQEDLKILGPKRGGGSRNARNG